MKEKKLNSEQKEAVEYLDGPLLIVAGAGTGKTTVITEKIKYLISQKKAKTAQILALTFTQKAAAEMEERVDVALPYGYTDTWIMTFHSFCDRILKEEAINIGLNPRYRLLTQAETVQLIIDNLFKLDLNYFRPLGNPTKFVHGLLAHFSRLRDEDVSSRQYRAWAKEKADQFQKKPLSAREEKEKIEIEKDLELAAVYHAYQKIKREKEVADFSDLIANTLDLFRRRPNVLARYQKQFKYVLVDEFQDTNIAQYRLLKLLVPPGKKNQLSVVADDSQSIYHFRGAAFSNVLQFMDDYPQAKSVILIKNYRSTQRILDAAYALIQHNNPDTLESKLGIDKNLRSVSEAGQRPNFILTDRIGDETGAVVNEIVNLVENEKGWSYSDIAILVRANSHAEPFIQTLKQHNIPYQFLGPGMLFRQSEIKDLIAYLFVLDNYTDDVSFYRLLAMRPFDLSGRDLAALVNFARQVDISLFEAGELVLGLSSMSVPILPTLSTAANKKLKELITMIREHLDLLKKETAGQVLYYFLQGAGLIQAMIKVESLAEEKKVKNISRFFDRLKEYDLAHEDASVAAVSNWLRMALDLGDSPLAERIDWFEENRVNILTVHSAKGLEFPAVFLVNLVPGRFPTYHRKEQIPIPMELIKEILPEGDYHEQEERRLFYVGMTRAKKRLFLTTSKYYGAGKRARRISPFVMEALGEEVVNNEQIITNDQLSIFKYQPKIIKVLPSKKKKQKKELDYFSFSQITTFQHCPAQYSYRYLQKIPTSPTGAQNFGSMIHQTLFDFYHRLKIYQSNKKDWQKEASLEKLLSFYEDNWSLLVFPNRNYAKKLKKQGRKMLESFYKKDFSKEELPLFLEKKFTISLGKNVKIGGIFDRVDKKGDTYEIIDYKTGKAKDEKAVKKDLQMGLYFLAACDEGILGVKPENLIGTFYFLKENIKQSVTKSSEELVKQKKDILKEIEKMKKSDFAAKPGLWCNFCGYKMVCDAWR